MEMFGGRAASYLARTPRIPLFVLIFIGLETKNVVDYQGRAGSTSIVQWTLRPVIFGVEIRDSIAKSALSWRLVSCALNQGLPKHNHSHTIDTEMKAKRDSIKSELITIRITKAKAKENSGEGGST